MKSRLRLLGTSVNITIIWVLKPALLSHLRSSYTYFCFFRLAFLLPPSSGCELSSPFNLLLFAFVPVLLSSSCLDCQPNQYSCLLHSNRSSNSATFMCAGLKSPYKFLITQGTFKSRERQGLTK